MDYVWAEMLVVSRVFGLVVVMVFSAVAKMVVLKVYVLVE
jgi:hypothetical protein